MAAEVEKYEVVIRGRETGSERFATYDQARWRADDLAQELGRECRVYRLADGMNARPVYRTGTKSDERF